MATKKPKAPPPPDKAKTVQISDSTGKSRDRLMAELVGSGVMSNAYVVTLFGKGTFGELALMDVSEVLAERAGTAANGSLRDAEILLAAQAAALDAVFCEMARRSAMNMGEYLDASERYMRLALKAQSQCRTTLETLAAIKNPPVVFARQANINNGGQQQVNNGTVPESAEASGPRAFSGAPAPAGISESPKGELLEGSDGQWLDTRTARAAGDSESITETLEPIDRADVR